MQELEMGKIYDWSTISTTYPNMYAIITDAVEKRDVVVKCRLLEVVPYEKKSEVVHRYKMSGMPFDCKRTTFNAPNVGVLF